MFSVRSNFNKCKKDSPFGNAGMMMDRHVYSVDADPVYDGPRQTLGGNLVDENFVPDDFFRLNGPLFGRDRFPDRLCRFGI